MQRKNAKNVFLSKGRLILLVLTVCALFCAIFVRLFFLHTIKSEETALEADKARARFEERKARRGDIVDARHNILATSKPIIVFGLDALSFRDNVQRVLSSKKPEAVEQIYANLENIALLLKIDYKELKSLCETSDKRWIKLTDQLDNDIFKQIEKTPVKGLYGRPEYDRVYPSGELVSHVVGFVNKEFVSVMGVENQFDYYLKGQDGWVETERDARRRELTQFRNRVVEPNDGMNVELTIDLTIQEMVQSELKHIAQKFSPQYATIIVSDPSTGYILAMGSYPNFNPNNFNKYDQDNFRNRAICDQYEPGSTFKIVAISAALNESLVGPEDTFDCNAATMTYKGKVLRLPSEAHSMGRLTVRDITKRSSNKGSAFLGGLLGEKKLYDYTKLYGFGEKTQLGLIGEVDGKLRPLNDWDSLTITRLPMGHAIATTPLQVHCAMSVIANQGIYMRPQLVRRIYDKTGETKFDYTPKAIRRVISPKISALMCEMLTEVVSKTGTASRAMVEGYKVAGKTGTSQKLMPDPTKIDPRTKKPKLYYSNRHHVASFTGFFPAQRPRLVITIVVDTPKMNGVGYGGLVAAPSFKNIAEKAASYLGIPTDDEFEKKVAWKGFQ